MQSADRPYKTWSANKSVRLAGFDYREHVPYHVTVCARAKTTPFNNEVIAKMVCETLTRLADELGVYVGNHVLMPDHLHALLSPDRSGLTLGEFIGRFKGVSTNASWKLGWSGVLWQDRFYDHIVRKSEGIAAVAKYIYENPDRKGLSRDYPFRWVAPDLV